MKKIIMVLGGRKNRVFYVQAVKHGRYRNTEFVLMATVLPVHVVQGVIKYPTGGMLKILDHARGIATSCTTNIWVTIPGADITIVSTAITAYGSATAGNRPGKKTAMTQAIESKLLAPFQVAANADPINSLAILQSGGFHVKQQAIRQIQQFEVKEGLSAGMVEIQTAGGPKTKNHLHNWFSSRDGIKFDWEKSTNSANTQLGPYPSGVKMHFQTELSVLDVLQGLSQIIDIRIK